MTSARTTTVALALLLSASASAQDVRGLEVCTAEKDLTRRTSCLQANVEFLQQELTKQARAATREVMALKTDIAALKLALTKTQNELAELKKKPAEKK